tara:strand:- start:1300 stop:3204 length:1905 start_codon:yes stop_codon:yes gene_type:complete
MKTPIKLTTIASISIIALSAQQAFAQNYGSFGDNIADPGNIPAILQQANDQDGTNFDTNFPASPPGFGNRYSNGLTAAELLPDLLDFDLSDVRHNAVGNAFSDKLPVSLAGGILLGSGSAIPGPIGRGLTPLNNTDIAAQVDSYLASVGPLGKNDFVLLYPSGNDGALALNTIALTGPPQDQALQIVVSGAQANAANTAASAQKLLNAGAGTVLVSNLPNIGQTPAARAGGLSGVQLATLFSTTTNEALNTALSQLATGNSSLIVADSFALTNDIVANPGKYGLTDVINPCSLVPSCVSANRTVQDQFLFWDPFFPTARGHEISAAFLADTVNAPRTVPTLSELGRFGTESYARGLLGQTGDGLWLAGHIGYERFRRDSNPFASGYEADGPTTKLALGWTGPTGLTIGVSAGYSDLDVDYNFISSGFDKRSVHLGAFAAVETPIVNLAASIGYGFDSYDNLSRNTGVAGQVSAAETEGDSFAIIAQASKDISFLPGFSLKPALRVGYSKADFDAFQETGATGLSQNVRDGSLSKTFAEIGAMRQLELLGLDARIGGYYHVRLDGGTQQIRTSLVSLPDFERTANVRAADRDYGRLEASLSKKIGNIDIGASGTATIASDNFDYLAGQLFLRLSF